MSYHEEYRLIRNRFENGWNSTGIPVSWPNEPFDKPNAPDPWVRFAIKAEETPEAVTISNTVGYRHPSTVIIELFTSPLIGLDHAIDMGDLIASLFRSLILENLVFKTPRVMQIGEVNGWWKTDVMCAFQRDSYITQVEYVAP